MNVQGPWPNVFGADDNPQLHLEVLQVAYRKFEGIGIENLFASKLS